MHSLAWHRMLFYARFYVIMASRNVHDVINALLIYRLESTSNKEDTVAFLSGLETLWNGYIDMPSVARYLTKAYPVSGILDHLTEASVITKPAILTFEFKASFNFTHVYTAGSARHNPGWWTDLSPNSLGLRGENPSLRYKGENDLLAVHMI